MSDQDKAPKAPFAVRSTITARSPDRTKLGKREPNVIPENRTRSQSTSSQTQADTPNLLQNTNTQESLTTKKQDDQKQPVDSKQSSSSQIQATINTTQNIKPQETPANKQKAEQKHTHRILKEQTVEMDLKQLQQNVANFIPEFSGEDTPQRSNKLVRFIGTADGIYNTLTTDEERRNFYGLVILRLTDDAYIRISHRDIPDYPTLKDTLNKMYARSYTLHELERGFTNLQQSYGETTRNYGYRLIEALQKYKTGYKTKYNLPKIDETQSKHLDLTLVQTFKSGLNNMILKEKIATIKANNVDEIINETETIEKLLALTHTPTVPSTPPQIPAQINQTIRNQSGQIICNYCQRYNHTWDTCRTRMSHEREKRMTTQQPQYNQQFQRNQYPQNQFPNLYRDPNTPQPYYKSNPAYPTQNQSYTPRQPIQNNYPTQPNQNYRQAYQQNRYPPKYCSHCKITTGHTFDECRSKYFSRNSNQYSNPNQNQPNVGRTQASNNELVNKFGNMRINTMYPQPAQTQQTIESPNQGNSNGSDQS